MHRYLSLWLILAIYSCHHAAQPNAQPFSEQTGPNVPASIRVAHEGTPITFAVYTTNHTESDQRIYLLLKADAPLTAEEVVEMAGDIIDAFITQDYYPWLQMRIETHEARVVKITCTATGGPSTTQSPNVYEMTPYDTEVSVEEP